MTMSFLENLEWRHAAKAFSRDETLPSGAMDEIFRAIKMAPTSYGLQPFKVIRVLDTEAREKIIEAGFNQPQFSTAVEVLVFCSRTDVEQRISKYFELACKDNSELRQKMSGYEKMMRGSLENRSEAELRSWSEKQIYIALGFAMAACAEKKIESCPMEGFLPTKVDQALSLDGELKSAVILTIGQRDESKPLRAKVRFDDTELFAEK